MGETIVTQIFAQLALLPQRDRRQARRRIVSFAAALNEQGTSARRVFVSDLSEQGFRLSSEPGLEEGLPLLLKLPGIEAVRGRVIWAKDGEIGCEFDEELDTATIESVIASATQQPAKVQRVFGLN